VKIVQERNESFNSIIISSQFTDNEETRIWKILKEIRIQPIKKSILRKTSQATDEKLCNFGK